MGIIRLLLACAVFNSHFPFLDMSVVDGHEAVLAFFAISGFYIALILDTAYATPGRFYLGRFLSLYPLYALALCISIALLVVWDIHPMVHFDKMRSLLSDPASFLVMAWTSTCVFGQELLFSLAPSPDGGLHMVEKSRHAIWQYSPMIQAWSLSLEIVFYAMAPLLVRLKTRTLCGLVAISLCAKIAVMASPVAHVVFFTRFFPIEFWLFGAGILAYRVHRALPQKPHAIDIFAFVFLIGFIFIVGDVDDIFEPFALPLVTLLALPFVFRAFKSVSFDREIGKVSYPLYLLHFSVIAVFEKYWEEPVGWHILVAALVSAVLVHLAVNPVIEFFKHKVRRSDLSPLPVKLTVQPEFSTRNN